MQRLKYDFSAQANERYLFCSVILGIKHSASNK